MTFMARYPGECAADCGEQIREGDAIRRTHGGYAHAVCPPKPPQRRDK